jgi:SAM-dependent methyltransferase
MTGPYLRPDEQASGSKVLTDVSSYYTSKLQQHGTTPRGVDWNGAESQQLRFAQLSRIVAEDGRFSINDLGCGYGALLDYLETRFTSFTYVGCDVCAAMIAAARSRHRTNPNARYHETSTPPEVADYGVASGIFNVRLGHGDAVWRDYVKATLAVLDRTSRRGFAFNCLTTYSDPDKARADLFYADPCEMFDYCKRSFSRNVALLHDYGLYEFTILVRKAL